MGSCNYTMAALARSYQKFLRVAPQAPAIARQMSGGHGGGYETWKKGFFFAAIPIIILGHVNAFGMADESAHAAPSSSHMTTLGSGARSSPGEMETTPFSTTAISTPSPTAMRSKSTKS